MTNETTYVQDEQLPSPEFANERHRHRTAFIGGYELAAVFRFLGNEQRESAIVIGNEHGAMIINEAIKQHLAVIVAHGEASNITPVEAAAPLASGDADMGYVFRHSFAPDLATIVCINPSRKLNGVNP